ncbi:MAG: phosphate ABC transporter substrate-binding protein [Magnetococcales bacterium]|nr:phosphate ABC transporter substrate-binding protein [Magnetococcales bacterium]
MKPNKLTRAVILAAGLIGLFSMDANARTLIQNKGSDTLVNVAQAWADAYLRVKPSVAVTVSGGGSGTGIAAMINGTVDLANSSRSIKQKELDQAKKNRIKPLEHIVGFDALAIFIHKDNPLQAITLQQLKDIYVDGGKTVKWGQLGVKVPRCQSDEIIVVGRQNNSGTYFYFQETVLGEKNNFRLGTKEMHDSKGVVDLVEKTPCAIGYSGLAYGTPLVKKPLVAKDDSTPPVEANMANAITRAYPITRPLFIYSKGEPTGEVKNYLKWIKSDIGQCIIKEKGYAPAQPVNCVKK